MKLYHYSDKELKIIEVKHFAKNSYSFNEKKASSIERSFFYLEQNPKEHYLENSKYCYIVDIANNKLYDLREDKENLKVKYQNNTEGLLEYLKENYLGAIYNVGFDIAILFYDIQVIAKIYH